MTKIWAISREELFRQGHWNGLQTENMEAYLQLFREKGEFLERDALEEDRRYKQIVGQVLLQVGDKFLIHKITSKGSESRLHEMWPIFLGGHIEALDRDAEGDLVMHALDREFHEEVLYHGTLLEKRPLGIIALEDANPVNYVHIGLVYLYVGDSEFVESNEDVLEGLSWVTLDELASRKDQLTYWSQIILPELPRLMR